MKTITSQADFDAAIANGDREFEMQGDITLVVTSAEEIVLVVSAGQPRVEAWGSSQPRVEAWESSQPRVEARESSQPRVVAWGSSQPRVEAWGSSQPRVVAWESSQPRVEAEGYVQLAVSGRVGVTAGPMVAVLIEGASATVEGGHQTRVQRDTAAQWCAYYGVRVVDGVATLYKALNDDFTSPHGMSYAPGTTPIAPDWDGGHAECGGGLHFSPSPGMAREFHESATKFMACPVALVDIAVHPDGSMPQKVKARGCCGPCVEVDEDGDPIHDVATTPSITSAPPTNQEVHRG